MGVREGIFWAAGHGWRFFVGVWGCVEVGGGIFWVDGGGWIFFMGEWGWVRWVEVYFG